MKPQLTVETLRAEAATFAEYESVHDEPSLFGVTAGKAVGTYLEHKFQNLLNTRYTYDEGSSAKGIDYQQNEDAEKPNSGSGPMNLSCSVIYEY